MRTRRWAPVAVLVVIGMGFAPLAAAQESLVEFTTTSTGSRTVTLASAPQFPPTTDLSLVGGDISTAVAASTTLTELFASGASWSVKAQMCGPDDYAAPTAADCATYPNQMQRASGGAAEDRLDGSTISVTRTPIVNGGLPLHTVTAGSETDLGSQITLMTSSDEVATTAYSGAYSTTTSLTVNDLIRTGDWKGYWVITQTT